MISIRIKPLPNPSVISILCCLGLAWFSSSWGLGKHEGGGGGGGDKPAVYTGPKTTLSWKIAFATYRSHIRHENVVQLINNFSFFWNAINEWILVRQSTSIRPKFLSYCCTIEFPRISFLNN